LKLPASTGGKVMNMDMLFDNGVVHGGWLFDRAHNGFSNGMVSDLERISPPVDVVEDNDGYRFTIEVPGLKADSLEVKVEDETLVINAERNERAWAKDARVLRAERHYGRIHRAFRLPGDAGHDAIKATYKDGVLEVTIAKRPEAKAVKVEVAYSS
jgi:HSP20 family protein